MHVDCQMYCVSVETLICVHTREHLWNVGSLNAPVIHTLELHSACPSSLGPSPFACSRIWQKQNKPKIHGQLAPDE